jgi:hypothetical protein
MELFLLVCVFLRLAAVRRRAPDVGTSSDSRVVCMYKSRQSVMSEDENESNER